MFIGVFLAVQHSLRIGVIVPAGGTGSRLGSATPKQYLSLGGIPIIVWSIKTVLQIPYVVSVVIAAHTDNHALITTMLSDHGCSDARIHLVEGGTERHISVYNALQHTTMLDVDIICVHDAVRPFASIDLWNRVIKGAITHGAAIPGLPVTDTIKFVDESGVVTSTPNRSALRSVQTPQCFQRAQLLKAYEGVAQLDISVTDCSGLCERTNIPVHVVTGEERNIKITTAFDMEIADLYTPRN